jgi:hypothetical protein
MEELVEAITNLIEAKQAMAKAIEESDGTSYGMPYNELETAEKELEMKLNEVIDKRVAEILSKKGL